MQRLVSPACGIAVYETKVKDGSIYVDLQPKRETIAAFAVTGESVPPVEDGRRWSFVMTEEELVVTMER